MIEELASISHSRAESLRHCFLRAVLDRDESRSGYCLGQPKAWLGTAAHEVLENVSRSAQDPRGVEAWASARWLEAVRKLEQAAQSHPLDRRFGRAEQWPGYNSLRAQTMQRARRFGVTQRPLSQPGQDGEVAAGAGPALGDWTAFDGRLRGRLDALDGDIIVDYKTGEVYEQAASGRVVKPAFVRQLQLYACLFKERMGRWPAGGRLITAAGTKVDVPLDPVACEAEACSVLALLDKFNDAVGKVNAGTRSLSELATPSESACRHCAWRVLCGPYWRGATEAWVPPEDDAATAPRSLGGLVLHASGGAGRLHTLRVQADSGSGVRGEVVVSRVPAEYVKEPLCQAFPAPGDRVRVDALRPVSGQPASYEATTRTLVVRMEDIRDVGVS